LGPQESRRSFIGGSDARIIMGNDEEALVRLWREKRGEVEPKDLSGNLLVQLGVATEALNRRWYEANTGQVITDIQRRIRHPTLRWMAASSTAASRIARPYSKPNSCFPGRFPRKRPQRNTCRSFRTTCGSSRHNPTLTFPLLPLTQTHPRAPTVFVDELNPSPLQYGCDSGKRFLIAGIPSGLDIGDRVAMKLSGFC
jgi:hypothetical protein